MARCVHPCSTSPSACAPPPPRKPDGLEDAIRLLHLAGPGRVPHTAGVARPSATASSAASLSSTYDNLGGEVARTTDQVASGVLLFGDLRDALVEGPRKNRAGVGLALGGRLARQSTRSSVSTFASTLHAEVAVSATLRRRRLEIQQWLSPSPSGRPRLSKWTCNAAPGCCSSAEACRRDLSRHARGVARVAEIDEMLDAGTRDDELSSLLRSAGLGYHLERNDVRAWLVAVRDRLAASS